MKRLFFDLQMLLWVALVFAANPAGAQGYVVDQSATPREASPGQFQFVLLSGGVGQEFVPSLEALDFVDLLLASMMPGDGGTFQVAIRESSIGGIVRGVSQPLTITGAAGPVMAHFAFANTLSLVPGRTYVLEIPHSGPYWGAAVGQSTYDQGQSINLAAGQWPGDHDLWFREGIMAVPEPGVGPLAGAAVVWVFLKRRFQR